MDTAGMVMILIGIYLLTSAVKNRRPIETARAMIQKPGSAKSVLKNADGYEATETGSPRLVLFGQPSPPGSGTDSGGTGDGSLNIGGPVTGGKKLPGGVERGLKPNAVDGGRKIYAHAPWIKSMGGLGSRPIGTSDHPRGLAIDFMIPGWNTAAGNAKGWALAKWIVANAGALHVKYVIWDRKKWNPAGGSGWRPYSHPLGASPTLAHRDHIHVSFKG